MDFDKAVKILEREFGITVHDVGHGEAYIDGELFTQEEVIDYAEKLKHHI